MTTGLGYLKESILRSLERPSKLAIPVDEELLAMLEELAERQHRGVADMAADLLAQAVSEHFRTTNENVLSWEKLSERQRQVGALACLEYTNAEIAEKLHISVETVKTHMREVLRKFDVKGRYQLAWMLRRWDFSEYERHFSD